jgi:hypothetical protein
MAALDPEAFCRVGTRRIDRFATAAAAPIVAGVGEDAHVYVWDVRARTQLCEFATSHRETGGVVIALSPTGTECFAGSYLAWGMACMDVARGAQLWHRPDLKRFHEITIANDGKVAIASFRGRTGLTLDSGSGESIERHIGLRGFHASRFDTSSLKEGRQFDLCNNAGSHFKWPPESFALLCCTFSPDACVVSESGVPSYAVDLKSGQRLWTYASRAGAHIIALDYCERLSRFVAVEYAYTEDSRKTGPMVALLHLDHSGRCTFRRPIREWNIVVFCAGGEFLLNGLGELHDTASGEVAYTFDFPR